VPPLPPAPGVLRVTMMGGMSPAKWMNGFYVHFTSATASAADLNSLASAISGFWASRFAPLCCTPCIMNSVNVIDLSSPTGNTGVDATVRSGTRTGNMVSANVACVCSLHIARRYRGGHPRMYIPGAATSDVSNPTTWTAAYVASVTSNVGFFLADINGLATIAGLGTLQFGSLSYYLGYDTTTRKSALRSSPIFSAVDKVTTHARIDSQRRRLGKEQATV
jgi:hypothetical protein